MTPARHIYIHACVALKHSRAGCRLDHGNRDEARNRAQLVGAGGNRNNVRAVQGVVGFRRALHRQEIHVGCGYGVPRFRCQLDCLQRITVGRDDRYITPRSTAGRPRSNPIIEIKLDSGIVDPLQRSRGTLSVIEPGVSVQTGRQRQQDQRQTAHYRVLPVTRRH